MNEPVIDESAAKRIATALGWEPKREWVGLTYDEIVALWIESHNKSGVTTSFAKAIEAALKEKNHDNIS
jgi:hypothetical protein